jgi:hypothetical protein
MESATEIPIHRSNRKGGGKRHDLEDACFGEFGDRDLSLLGVASPVGVSDVC